MDEKTRKSLEEQLELRIEELRKELDPNVRIVRTREIEELIRLLDR